MKTQTLLVIMITSIILITGCKLGANDVYNFFGGLNVMDYTLNCTLYTNISLDTPNCISPKRAIFVNYNNTMWNEVCCAFDARCLAIANANLSNGCNNVSANFSYMGAALSSAGVITGSICCNGVGTCYVDTLTLSNCTNADYAMATLSFNLTNTTEWDAICCKL
jgi:hypothetical protein